MSTVIEVVTPTDTTHHIESATDRAKFLRRVLREDGWTISARSSEDWQFVFRRTIRGKPGDPNVDVIVRIKDKFSLVGKWGNQKSFHDSDEVIVPKPTRLWLAYGSQQAAVKFLLEGCHFIISGSSGSTSSSKHGLAFVSLQVLKKDGYGTVEIGGGSVYVNGRMVCCGSVE
jgi:hypothetical protein